MQTRTDEYGYLSMSLNVFLLSIPHVPYAASLWLLLLGLHSSLLCLFAFQRFALQTRTDEYAYLSSSLNVFLLSISHVL